MLVLHTSDLHGGLFPKLNNKPHLISKFDLWIDTGDFFPNDPIISTAGWLGWERTINKKHEIFFQKDWLKRLNILEHMVNWLNGRPFISVQGNHDFISLADELREFGYDNVFEIDVSNDVDLFDHKFCGFPNIPYICGEWNHETFPASFYDIINELKLSACDILITHAPPYGILDAYGMGHKLHSGVGHLNTYLAYQSHNIKHHFFGHCHEFGGQTHTSDEMGIRFINGAKNAILHNVK